MISCPAPITWLGQLALLMGRRIPEYILAFIFSMLFGPPMLSAIIALAIYNDCITLLSG